MVKILKKLENLKSKSKIQNLKFKLQSESQNLNTHNIVKHHRNGVLFGEKLSGLI